jgi:hypothetical protein
VASRAQHPEISGVITATDGQRSDVVNVAIAETDLALTDVVDFGRCCRWGLADTSIALPYFRSVGLPAISILPLPSDYRKGSKALSLHFLVEIAEIG